MPNVLEKEVSIANTAWHTFFIYPTNLLTNKEMLLSNSM